MLGAVRAGGFRLAGATFLVASILPIVGGVPAACAAEGARAVLVVDTGESEHRMCVELPRQEVSGVDLIVLAAEQHGLSYRLGYGGGAVCMLAGVGTSGDDCFERYPEFWGYWRGDGSGGWQWSSTGAGSTRVSDGDVEGWSWGSGNDGASHPAPPPTTFSSVCPARSAPAARPKPKPAGDAEPAAEPRQESPKVPPRREAERPTPSEGEDVEPRRRARARADAGRKPPRRQKPRAKRHSVVKSPSQATATGYDAALPAAATRPPPSDPGGPPPAGIAAVAAACALAGAGAWLTRRRRDRT